MYAYIRLSLSRHIVNKVLSRNASLCFVIVGCVANVVLQSTLITISLNASKYCYDFLSLFLCLSLPLYVSLSVCLSHCLSLQLYPSNSGILSVPFSPWCALGLSLSLWLSLSLTVSLTLVISVSFSGSLSLPTHSGSLSIFSL